MQSALLEAEPDVGVEFAGFFKGMLGEVEDEDLAAGLQDAVSFFDGALGVLGVMEGLAEDREVHRVVGERDTFDVAEFIGEVGEAVFGGELGADFDHTGGVVDAPDLRGALGEELGDEAFAGAEIGDRDRGREAQGEVADRFPRTPGAVGFAKAAGDQVEVLFLSTPALLEDAVKVGSVVGEFGQGSDGGNGGAEQGE